MISLWSILQKTPPKRWVGAGFQICLPEDIFPSWMCITVGSPDWAQRVRVPTHLFPDAVRDPRVFFAHSHFLFSTETSPWRGEPVWTGQILCSCGKVTAWCRLAVELPGPLKTSFVFLFFVKVHHNQTWQFLRRLLSLTSKHSLQHLQRSICRSEGIRARQPELPGPLRWKHFPKSSENSRSLTLPPSH